MNVPLLDLKAQYAPLRERIRAAMDEVCDGQQFILGPRVERFERRIAEYCGARFAVGASSGTDALLMALTALGVGPGDGVITTPYTFFATAGSIARLGAVPLFADVEPGTWNLSAERVRELLGRPRAELRAKPKAMVPVHLFGQCADMDPLLALAREHGLKVVEDAAQALGAEYPAAGAGGRRASRRAASMGDAGCLSFFPSKNLGGFGDGGMAVTDDAGLAERMRMLRNHGAGAEKYRHAAVGGNFRLDALQAAVLDVKLDHLESWLEGRRTRAARYDRAFGGTRIAAPEARYRASGLRNFHTYHQYVVRVPGRDGAARRLRDGGIGCEVYYPLPLHLQECFRELGHRPGDFPESEKAAAETLALPVYAELPDEGQDRVIAGLLGEGD